MEQKQEKNDKYHKYSFLICISLFFSWVIKKIYENLFFFIKNSISDIYNQDSKKKDNKMKKILLKYFARDLYMIINEYIKSIEQIQVNEISRFIQKNFPHDCSCQLTLYHLFEREIGAHKLRYVPNTLLHHQIRLLSMMNFHYNCLHNDLYYFKMSYRCIYDVEKHSTRISYRLYQSRELFFDLNKDQFFIEDNSYKIELIKYFYIKFLYFSITEFELPAVDVTEYIIGCSDILNDVVNEYSRSVRFRLFFV